jgi:hypothetical protein
MENLKFKNLGDFGTKGITAQSSFLTGLETEKDQYQKIVKQLKTNKILKAALEDPDAKKALHDTLQSLIKIQKKQQIVLTFQLMSYLNRTLKQRKSL